MQVHPEESKFVCLLFSSFLVSLDACLGSYLYLVTCVLVPAFLEMSLFALFV